MSILIKGMEMPKTCELCPLVDRFVTAEFKSIKCKVTKKLRPDSCLTRPDSCPLIEVPEPHGRLADIDAVISVLEEMSKEYPPDSIGRYWISIFSDILKADSTVILASESKERPAFLPQYELTPRSEEG